MEKNFFDGAGLRKQDAALAQLGNDRRERRFQSKDKGLAGLNDFPGFCCSPHVVLVGHCRQSSYLLVSRLSQRNINCKRSHIGLEMVLDPKVSCREECDLT